MTSGGTGGTEQVGEATPLSSWLPRSRVAQRAGALVQPLRRFAHDRHGVVAVELGLVGLPFFMLISSIVVLGFMTFCAASLDYATQKAVRQLMIGTTTNANMSATQFRTSVICPLLPAAAFDCSKVVIDLFTLPLLSDGHGNPNVFSNFMNADQSGLNIPPLNNAQSTFCTGTANTYSVLEVIYPMPVYLSVFLTAPQVVNGQFVLMSAITFKNEPFQGTNSTTGC